MSGLLEKRVTGFILGLLVGGAASYFLFGDRAGGQGADADTGRRLGQTNPLGSLAPGDGRSGDPAGGAEPAPTGRATSQEAYSEQLYEALSIVARHDRLREFLVLLEGMGPEDGPAILKVFGRMDRQGGQYPLEWQAFVTRWGEVNGVAAASHHLARIDERWARGSISSVFAGWAKHGAEEAVEFINGAEFPEEITDIAILGLISGVGDSSPQRALEVAVANVDKDDRRVASRAMEAVAESAVRQGGTEAVLGVFGELPDPAWKRAAFPHVWWRLQHSDQDTASQWLVDHSRAEWANPTQYRETIQSKARSDPRAALEWASQLPVELASDQKQQTFRTWQQQDAAAADLWLQGQPDELVRLLSESAGAEE